MVLSAQEQLQTSINMKAKILFFSMIFLFISCDRKGIGDLNTFDEEGKLHSVVSIGAGTVIPYIYDIENKAFKSEIIEGKEKLIEFLPPPFNIGVIPSSNKNQDQLIETIILSSNFSTGSLIKCNTIGALVLEKSGKEITKVICLPDEKSVRNINAESLEELSSKYPGSMEIIINWFESNGYKLISKLNSKEALNFIKENSIR